MNKKYYLIPALMALFVLACCAPKAPFEHEYASGHYSSDIQQCAIYARGITGVKLYGDAYSWWGQAKSHYRRGHKPEPGAILVLKKTARMHSGHVAVVKDVISAREINVTHSDWGSTGKGRHIIYDSHRVEDISPKNDWSQVRFWNDEKNVMGFPYAAYGFIYP